MSTYQGSDAGFRRKNAGIPGNGGMYAEHRRVAPANVPSLDSQGPERIDFEELLYDYEVNLKGPGNPGGFPYPQANDLEKVVIAVDAVSNGVDTHESVGEVLGYSDRQGAYYADAAGYLGLVEKEPGVEPVTYHLTPLGKEMVNLSTTDRCELVCRMVMRTPPVQDFTNLSREEFVDAVAREGDVESTTAERRADCVTSWVSKVTDRLALIDDVEGHLDVSSPRYARAAQKAAEARERARKASAPAPPPKVCPSCFIQLPKTGVCDECD